MEALAETTPARDTGRKPKETPAPANQSRTHPDSNKALTQ